MVIQLNKDQGEGRAGFHKNTLLNIDWARVVNGIILNTGEVKGRVRVL